MGKRYVVWASLIVLGVLFPLDLAAQDRRIAGTVVQATTGEPISAAQVSVSGGRAATLSDADGRFLIAAPAGEVTLQVRAFGYQRAEVVVSAGQDVVEIRLETDVFRMDELVVTGQATSIERRSAATAIEYVSGEDIADVPSSTVLGALNGKVSGVNLQANSGAPGGGMQMQIRGNATILGAHDPLYVVDGVIYSNASIPSGRGYANNAASPSAEADAVNRIADLNPADIESIEILKGAAASSIYGSKASNGVVVITTNRGTVGEPEIRLTQRLGVSMPANLLESRRWNEADTPQRSRPIRRAPAPPPVSSGRCGADTSASSSPTRWAGHTPR
ncbi:MAG TPA: TonB-dependent receptor plug domain-containing protein, partial [Longimicrobiales bacterium]|nr:TonB-dependent receptor plug domain-containing protein [Longimicrobiales bacterium]